jgi:hypothetical protein
MKLLIVHLSDIHFAVPGNNVVMDRATAIANAAHSVMPDANAVVFALVGDLAQKGTKEEYELMRNFLSALISSYRARNPALAEAIVAAVPGNHDCFLAEDQTARDAIIKSLTRENITKSSMFSTLVHPQRHFFEFVDSGLGCRVIHPGREAVASQTVEHGDGLFDIVCINTALCSRVHESPGTLHLPPLNPPAGRNRPVEPSASIVLAHHPLHWLTPESCHDLRDFVIARNAILLTGHEHQPDLWTAGQSQRLAQLVEGGVLQQALHPSTSSFHTLSLDTASGELFERTFEWSHNVYVGGNPRQLAWSRPAGPPRSVKLSLSSKHAEFLEDLGGVVTHPERDTLRLSDIFLLPHLKYYSASLRKSKSSSVIKSDRVFGALLEHQLAQITGGSRTGKTALAKRLFHALWAAGKLPLFVSGDALRSTSANKIQEKLADAVVQNYRVNHPDEYFASEHELVLIVDDFDRAGGSSRGQDAVLGYLRSMFKHVVVFDRNRPDLDEFVAQGALLENIKDLAQFEILPFGSAMREEFVEKWVLLGKTAVDPEPEVRAQVLETTSLVETLLGRDLVPRTPFYLLCVLSSLQQVSQPAADLGSLGYLYELMIRNSLAKATRRTDLMQTLDGFLSDLAFSMYASQSYVVTRDGFKARCDDYAARCLIDLNDREAEDVLRKAMIISADGGRVFFRYKYLYYFFVAKYMSQRLSTFDMQQQVRQLSKDLHRTESAYVLQFLCHCTSDPIIIECMTERAAELFTDSAEVNLETDCKFLNELYKPPTMLSLGPTNASENRKRLLEAHDAEEHQRATGALSGGSEPEMGNHLAPPLEDSSGDRAAEFRRVLVASFKTMEIAGQILRNHPTITGADKIRLIKACTSLSRRMIMSMFNEMKENASVIMDALQRVLKERDRDIDAVKANKIASLVFQQHIEGLVIGIVASYAKHFGIPGLAPAFRRLRSEVPGQTIQLFDLAVQLENPREFPEVALKDVDKAFSGNLFVWSCVQDMVFLYYYLFAAPDRAQKQRVCSAFKIDFQSPSLLDNDQKLKV